MTARASFRSYCVADREACLAIFDANCPSFFLPNERVEYASFLDAGHENYEVCEMDGRVIASFGLLRDENNRDRLCWIMLEPDSQGVGIGSLIMQRVISLGRILQSRVIYIAASHKSAPFFAKFGAVATGHKEDGWGPGLDRVDMELRHPGTST